MSRRIAFLIDGGFFLKRLPYLVRPEHCVNAERITVTMRHLCRNHVKMLTGLTGAKWIEPVYRIFYYDAVPYGGKAHHPIDNRPIDFDKSNIATERRALFDSLRRQRKVALRDLWLSLDGGSVALGLKQKGVDMRIGVDIASLVLKKQVDTIVLVAGDSDFVPAAKLARREGIDFILDPLWQQINADLFEHIDGLQSGLSRPGARAKASAGMAADIHSPDRQPDGTQ